MFLNATYKVRADEDDFPYIGQIITGMLDGVIVSTVVKEIQKVKWYNPDWKEKNAVPICIVQLLVMVDEKEYARKKKKQHVLNNNKLIILEGGMSSNNNN